ncbi:MAG TPA: Vps62-related protein [Blastocatellia bacterium]|nr:Vps62-related protein [Blastocatellia bacterium]
MSASQPSPSQVSIISATNPRTGGDPYLRVSFTSQYGPFLYTDVGSDAYTNVSIFRPTPASGWFILGDYAQPDYQSAYGTSCMVQEHNSDPSNPILMAPTGYVKLWDDTHSGGEHDGSVWRPTAPEGYVAIGDVCGSGHSAPDISEYRCVRHDYAQLLAAPANSSRIWADEHSDAWGSVALYPIPGVAGAFTSVTNYEPPTAQIWSLKGPSGTGS